MAILTRQTTASGVTNNGAPLTNDELDNNFVELQQNKVNTSDLNEAVDDRVNNLLQAGLGIDLTYDDVNDELTIDSNHVEVTCTNETGASIPKGTVVYQTGVSGNNITIAPADADDAAKMPAIGLTTSAIADTAEGTIIILGVVDGLDTSAYAAGDTLYVSTTAGALSTAKPTGETGLIQNFGRVLKVNASSGAIAVMGAGRSNAVPNLNDGNVFIGNASNQAETRALAAGDIQSGTFADARISQGNVTQHEAALSITESQISDFGTYLPTSGGTMTGSLTLNADPTANLQAATKQYVDTLAAASLHYHDPVRVEREGNLTATYDNGTAGVGATLTNSGAQAALVIDGVTLSTNDRVLIYEQTNAFENGIYTVTDTGSASTNWVLTRATDADSYSPSDPDSLGEGDAFFVLEGTLGAGELYVMNTSGSITFGTTGISFAQVSSAQVYTGGTGISIAGSVISSDITLDEVTANGATTANNISVGAVTFTDLNDGTITITGFVDEDAMTSDSASLLPTQQSVKAYVDSAVSPFSTTLDGLTDTTVTTVSDNEVLAYDSATSKWINQTAAEASLATAAQGSLADTALQPADLSVTTNAAGTAALTYTSGTGVFSYTPPDLSGYLTSYTETDTLDSVTGRGATTTNAVTVGNLTSTGIDDNATSTAITIDSSENVGIGTTPGKKLVVSDGNELQPSTGGYIALVTGNNDGAVRGAGIDAYSVTAGNDHGLRFYTNQASSAPAESMRIDSSGNVGIGTTTPSEKLNVSGNILATGNVTAYSDARLKSDVETLDGSKVYEMRGVSFTKDGEAGSGVIAQELQKVAPELVNDSGEYLSVAYGNLVGYLIEAVKELKAEIDELKGAK
jgi:hypothetical protein